MSAPDAAPTTTVRGQRAEGLACAHLERLGYEILERNVQAGRNEIDVVARDGKYLVFVEVRSRRRDDHGHPFETVNHRKQQHLIRAARHYLARTRQGHLFCRFDVVAILGEGERREIELVKGAFEARA
jgi:putative endonuclease